MTRQGCWLAACGLLVCVGIRAQPCDYEPTGEVFLNTDITWVTPVNCAPYTVAGGVFVFRNVHIKSGVIVRGIGSRPMIWVVLGDFVVDGHLRVDGGDGASVNSIGGASLPVPVGLGVCSGGDGGRGSYNTLGQSLTGEAGFGPEQVVGLGGGGGRLALITGCGRGSGGGGGSLATVGDPFFKTKSIGTSFVQQFGFGGFGCAGPSGAPSRSLPGGSEGLSPFVDARRDNDFFGTAVNVQRGVVIPGELARPMGGSGGGGGGDLAPQLGNLNWIANNKGGSGGGGGGALIVCAAGKIDVAGRITANGGHGGGGERAGSNDLAGGGGGGSGGTIILYSLSEIVLHTRGETYANDDYDFSISADGGVGLQSNPAGVSIRAKYPPPQSAALWDQNPTGGMGGLGVIELFAPPGNNADGTNTILDDNVAIVRAGLRLTGTEKIRYLGWRGFPNTMGVWVDDNNFATYHNPPSTAGYPSWASTWDDEGDIRPAPILLPILP